jgi:hypothetical protein
MKNVVQLLLVSFTFALLGSGCSESSSGTAAPPPPGIVEKSIQQQVDHLKAPPANAPGGAPNVTPGQMGGAMQGMIPKQHQGKAGIPGGGPPAGGAPTSAPPQGEDNPN